MAHIQLNQLSKSYDGQTLAVQTMDLTCCQGEMLALLGPSGCGKSSTLKMVAGIEPVTSGEILFDGVDVTHRDSAGRNVAMVFEDYALYPHMTVRANIGFPLRVRRTSATDLRKKVDDAMELLGLTAMADEPVRSLSGGAQQRVSIGRALVRDPALVMFDEPLSHLDGDQKVVLRTEIRRMQSTQGLTSVLVTHDQTEAMAMADRIAVMNHGVLQQVGSPQDLYVRPSNRFVAGFIGETPMNFLDAALDMDGRIILPGGQTAPLRPIRDLERGEGPLVLGIRPEDIMLQAISPAEPALSLSGKLLDRECGGDRDVLRLTTGTATLHAEVAAPAVQHVGDTVTLHLPLADLHDFDPSDGRALGAIC